MPWPTPVLPMARCACRKSPRADRGDGIVRIRREVKGRRGKTVTAISGIGPWTAEVYLLFAAGHPDIFPSGDIALQNAWQMIFVTEKRPAAKELAILSSDWSPWRGTAARLLWAYYGATKGMKDKSPV